MYKVLFLLLIINSYPVYYNTILRCRPSVSVSVPFSRNLFSHRFHSAICWIPFSFLFRFCNETIPLSLSLSLSLSFRFRREGNNGGPMYAHVSEPDNSFLRSSAPRRAFGLILQAIRETFVTWLRDWVMEHSSGIVFWQIYVCFLPRCLSFLLPCGPTLLFVYFQVNNGLWYFLIIFNTSFVRWSALSALTRRLIENIYTVNATEILLEDSCCSFQHTVTYSCHRYSFFLSHENILWY